MTEALTANEVLTMEEIKKRFDEEWILLENPILNEHKQVVGGKLLFHSKDRDELDRVMLKLRPRNSAVFYTGPVKGLFALNL